VNVFQGGFTTEIIFITIRSQVGIIGVKRRSMIAMNFVGLKSCSQTLLPVTKDRRGALFVEVGYFFHEPIDPLCDDEQEEDTSTDQIETVPSAQFHSKGFLATKASVTSKDRRWWTCIGSIIFAHTLCDLHDQKLICEWSQSELVWPKGGRFTMALTKSAEAVNAFRHT
jgi:hypothetical protein